MDDTGLSPDIVSLLNRIARAERFAAAMCSQEGRDRFLAIAAELQHELDLIQDQRCGELNAETSHTRSDPQAQINRTVAASTLSKLARDYW
jgi:hypothetical protein